MTLRSNFRASMPRKNEPIYHRLGDKPELIEEIKRTGLLKGRARRHIYQSTFPKVKAKEGPLPEGEVGFEFTTSLPPDPGCQPGWPTWIGTRVDVAIETNGDDEFAIISITVLKVR